MRTVTFSSTEVRDRLAQDFVCCTVNTTGDPSAGASCAHAPGDAPGPCTRGIGHQNVQCLFLTPQGEIFHAASGHLDPDELLAELAFAKKTFDALRKDAAKARGQVVELHTQRLKELGFTDADLKAARNGLAGFFPGGPMALPPGLQKPTGPGGLADLMGALGKGGLGDLMAGQSRRTILNDQKFSIDHPLLPFSQFQKQPQLLVGNEKTFFASSGGPVSGGTISGAKKK